MKKPDESYGYLLSLDELRNSGEGLGPITILQGEARLWVKAGTIYGLASAYTPSHVYVLWHSAVGEYLLEWLPAAGVHSVPEDQWHGLPIE